MKTQFKDTMGVDIYVGDIVLYSSKYSGGSIHCYKVVGETPQRLKVSAGIDQWTGRVIISHLMYPALSLVLNNTDPQVIFDKMNKQ